MNKKHIVGLLIFVFLLLLPVYAETTISVVYKGCPMEIKPSPTVVNGRTLIPLRSIMENFGADVEWVPASKSIIIKQKDTVISLQIDNCQAAINGVSHSLDSAPQLIENRTYVPLRFISESLDLLVRWDSTSRTVYLSDSSDPSLNPSDSPALTIVSLLPPTSSTVLGPAKINMTASDAVSALGQPARIDQSYYGFDWYIYNSDYSNYQQVGIKDNRVIAQYGFNIAELSEDKIHTGMTRLDVEEKLGACITSIRKGNTIYTLVNKNQSTYKLGSIYYTCYFDSSPKELLYAVALIDSAIEESFKGYYGTPSPALVLSFERELFDITNAYRALKDLPAFQASSELDQSARAYSNDMGNLKFFAHVSPTGQTLKNRMDAFFKKYSKSGENLASGPSDSIQAFNCWVNSPGHLTNILGDFDHLGVGVYLGVKNQTYYTQHFIKNGQLK